MQESPETVRGIEYFRNIVETGKILRLSTQPVNQGNSYLMIVNGFDNEWYFSLSRSQLNDLPATKGHHSSALELGRTLEHRFKNINPNYFVTQSGRLLEINIEWPSLPAMRNYSYIAANLYWVNLTDLVTKEIAKCPVEITQMQSLHTDILTPYSMPEYITNSVRAAIDAGSVAFRQKSDEHPEGYVPIKIQLGEYAAGLVSIQHYLAAKVWLLGFKAGDGRKDNKAWIVDPWDARYLGCSEAELRQAAAILDAQEQIVLHKDNEFANVGKVLLISEGPKLTKKAPAKSPYRTPLHVYIQKNVIGEGGSGRVLRVVDEDDVEHALKYLKPTTASSKKSKRFRNEMNFSSNNTHRNIIKITDRGLAEIDGNEVTFYVMPVYPQTLRALMDGSASSEKLMSVFLQILDGVEEAHSKQIWHRDLKPENILYDPVSNTAVVTDFGIAHFPEEYLLTEILTLPQERLANFRYAAPEQRSNLPVDGRADIYALGMILYEMFTGEFLQGSQLKKIGSVHPDLAHLDYLVERMTTQSPDDRIAIIGDVKRQIDRRSPVPVNSKGAMEIGSTSYNKKVAPVAYAKYETTGRNAVKAETYVRPSDEYSGSYTYEDSFGANRLESEEVAAQSFLATDRKLRRSGYIRMNYANLSGKNLFDL